MKSKIGGLVDKRGCLKNELETLASLGFDYAEFGLGTSKEFVEEYKNNYQEYKNIIPLGAAHMPSSDFKDEGVEKLKTFISDHLEIDCKNFICHFFTLNLLTIDKITPQRVAGLKKLAGFAKRQKANLIIENTYGVGVEDLEVIFKKAPGTYFCLDTGHANLSGGKDLAIRLIDNFGKKLKHIHAHDNFGGRGDYVKNDLHLPVGFGNIDFAAIFKQLKEINYSGNITLEVHDFRKESRKISIERIKTFAAS